MTGDREMTEANPDQKELYRYDDVTLYDGRIEIYLSKFEVKRVTPKGYWIRNDKYEETFCLSGSGKRFAHETKEKAFDSFKARKRRQRKIVSYQKRKADRVHELIKGMTEAPENPSIHPAWEPEKLDLELLK